MANELYFYAQPSGVSVTLVTDLSGSFTATACEAHGRSDAFRFALPADLPEQGGKVSATFNGTTRSNRGIIKPSQTGDAAFQFDDFGLIEAAAPVPEPSPEPTPPPAGTDPPSIINSVYATGLYDLNTKEGCGKFTEACCTALHDQLSEMWGHIKKNPGQNQWNGHAVDALMLLAGEDCGIWDIIYDSESTNAHPTYNYKGEPSPELWYYPA